MQLKEELCNNGLESACTKQETCNMRQVTSVVTCICNDFKTQNILPKLSEKAH
jgi:hypothetical protein